MTRTVTFQTIALTAGLGLLVAGCSQEKPAEPTSPIEAPAVQDAAAVGYACESGKTVVVAYPDAQTARVSYEGKPADYGYRIYYAIADGQIILLLCGGDKRTQPKDIEYACACWHDWKERGHERGHPQTTERPLA